MREWFQTILSMSLTAGVTALVVLPLRWLGQRLKLPGGLSVPLWLAVLVRMVLPTGVLTAPFSLLRWSAPAVETQAETFAASLPADVALSSGTAAAAVLSVPPLPWYFWAWLLGAVLLWSYTIFTWARLGAQVSSAICRSSEGTEWWESDRISSPFVYGLLRPRIFVPLGVEADVLPWVLRHEQSHIRLGHPVLKLFFFVALGVHWWNPVLWLAWFLFCRDLELQCDAAVLRRWPAYRKEYASALLALAAPHPAPFAPPGFGETGVGQRIRRVLNWRRPTVWAAAALLLVLVVGIGLVCDPLYRPLPQTTPELTLHLTEDGPGKEGGDVLPVSPTGEGTWTDMLPALHRFSSIPSPWVDLYLDENRMPDEIQCTEYLLEDGVPTGAQPAELSPYGSDTGFLLRVRPRGTGSGGLETRLYVLDCLWQSGKDRLSLSYAFQLTFPRVAENQKLTTPILVAGDTLLSDGGEAYVPYGAHLNLTHPDRSGEVSLTAHTRESAETDISGGSVAGGSTGLTLTPIGVPEGTYPPQTQYYTLTYTWEDGTQSIYTFTLHLTP